MPTPKRTRRSKAKGSDLSPPLPQPYQLPSATEDDHESLRASIEAHGVLLPVIENSDGTVIDGEAKKQICIELGLKTYPTEVLHVDAQTAQQIRLELNLCRRNMSLDSRRDLARRSVIADPEQSDRQIARLSGLAHRTVSGLREGLVVRGQIVQVKVRKGKDRKTYKKFPKVRAKTKKEIQRAAALLNELGADAPNRDMELRSANRRLRSIRKDRQKEQLPLRSGEIKIEHCDFRKLVLKPASVRLVFTDPLYTQKYIHLYGDLSKFAARVLQPGGILMAYAGTMYLNEVFRRLDEHLDYLWTCVLINEECSMPNFQRGFFSGHRPILCYMKGKHKWFDKGGAEKTEDYLRDTFQGRGKDKTLHPYQQSIDEAMYYIDKLSQPGDLIVDCFGGSFTTAEAVYRVGGRRFIGCDIDETCVAIGRERLAKLMETNHE